jgi:predicted patatin/cPLA2 family phospholipase
MPEGRTALVVEGGGMRGIFSAGVLDAFLEAGYNPFELLIGVSSGAVTLASYLSGQHRRYYRIITGPMSRSEFLSIGRFLKGGHLMDLDWLWDHAAAHDPLHVEEAVSHPGKEYLLGVTDVSTGEPVYIEARADTLLETLKASCALPVLYRGFVKLKGRLVTDGGVSDPIPVREAYRRGARDITVIRTRAPGSAKGVFFDRLMSLVFLRNNPALQSKIGGLHLRYRDSVSFINDPPRDAVIREISPPVALKGARLSLKIDSIRADYRMGKKAGREHLDCGIHNHGPGSEPGHQNGTRR